MADHDARTETVVLFDEARKAVWMDVSLCGELLNLVEMDESESPPLEFPLDLGLLKARLYLHQGDLVRSQAESTRVQARAAEAVLPLYSARALLLSAEAAAEGGNCHLAMEGLFRARSLLNSAPSGEESVALPETALVEAEVLLGMALLFQTAGDHRDALHHFSLAADARRAISPLSFANDLFFARLMTGTGLSFLELGDDQTAFFWLSLARGAAHEVSRIDEVRTMAALARILRRQGKREEAISLLEEAQGLCEKHDFPLAAIDVRLELATLLLEEDRVDRTREVLDYLLDTGSLSVSRARIARTYLLRALSFEVEGDLRGALRDYKRFHDLELSLSMDRITQVFLDGERRFEYERYRQEAELYRLRNVELKGQRERLEGANRRLFAVAELGRLITSSLEMEKVAQTVYSQLSALLPVDAFSLSIVEEERNELDYCFILVGGIRRDRVVIPLDSRESYAASAYREKEALLFRDLPAKRLDNDRFAYGLETHSAIFLPLFLAGRLVAVLGVRAIPVNAYSDEDLNLLSSLGAFIAVAVHNARNHRELIALNHTLEEDKAKLEKMARKISSIANHDGLTGLPNRLLLGEFMKKAIAGAARSKGSLALFFMDLDDFKPINDRFGHSAGDLALKEVAKRLQGAFRESDILARVGGDEFIAVACGLQGRDAAALIADKLIGLLTEPLDIGAQQVSLGVSVGISMYPGDGKKADILIQRADEAMYRVKKAKKNAWRFWREA